MPPATLTFGCRLNAAESLAMMSRAREAGLDNAILVNTCVVTAEAVRQARQAIRKARRDNPGARIVVSGCAAQTEPETFASMPEVDLVLGNEEKLRADSYRRVDRSAGDVSPGGSNIDVVMPGLDPGIHSVTPRAGLPDRMDRRVKPGDDDSGRDARPLTRSLRDRPLPDGDRNARRLSPTAPLHAFGLSASEKVRVGDIFSARETGAHLLDSLAAPDLPRAFVPVQNGCNHRCTFCIIPYGRGNSRSVPMGAVVEEVRRLAHFGNEGRGVAEIVLTGVDVTSYGADLPGAPKLGTLVRKILKLVPELPRLRLTSVDSVEADDELLRAFAEEERLMPHLHLSLQSGDDLILKRMKRRHSRADALRFAEEARRLRPDIVLGADLIAGFPTETDAMFLNTRALVEDCGLTLLHVFPFSPRPGTPAARMPQVDRHVAQARAKILRETGKRALAARLASEAGARRSILVERPGLGRTEHYLPVALEGGTAGEVFSAKIERASATMLFATKVRAAA